ncbi:MAG: hypothetical protein JWR51_4679 [Devosia sp.]|uniref:hypothetical protein n=1 Tax=Devosia sp. TaxID=1871048 RepID=UPI002618FB2A|nr:hypothetical protein [Devosia sp.]MDB5531576.1 hypothetical protein [Devosia sp.]
MTQGSTTTGELVERLAPSWKADELLSIIGSTLRKMGANDSADILSREIVANNALKREAVVALTTLERELEENANANARLTEQMERVTSALTASQAEVERLKAELGQRGPLLQANPVNTEPEAAASRWMKVADHDAQPAALQVEERKP